MNRAITDPGRFYRGLLTISFLFLAFGTVIAYQSPALSYELDIYRSTPLLFWFFVGSSLLISVLVALYQCTRGERNALSLVAIGLAGLLVVGIPVLRNHHHIGEGDMMTHIGWTNELIAGVIAPTDLFYPAIHLLAGTLVQILEIETQRAYLLLLVIFIGMFIAFTALCARRLSPQQGVLTVGVLFGVLLLPLNHSATHLQPLPRNVAIYLLPLLLFILVYQSTTNTIPAFILTAMALLAYLLIHPQFVLASIFVIVAYIGVAHVFRQSNGRRRSVLVRPAAVSSIAIALLTWFWIANEGIFERFFQLIVGFFAGVRTSDSELASRGHSLAELGAGLPELFVKLYFIPVVICLLVGLYGLRIAVRAYTNLDSIDHNSVLYLSLLAGIVPLAGIMAVFLAMGRVDYLFRYQGFVMAIVTVLGVIATLRVLEGFPTRRVAIFTPILLVAITLSLLVAFPSPYIYNDVEHVTEAQMNGYETMFDHADPAVSNYDHVRSSVGRHGNAILGPAYLPRSDYYAEDQRRGGAPDHFNDHDLPGYYSTPTYLAITTADKERDAGLYNGFRFSHADFAYLNEDPEISKVHSGRDVEFYYITPEEEGERGVGDEDPAPPQ